MNLPLWAQIPATIESYAKTAAVVLGGGWAIYRFGLGREREPALAIDIDHSEAPTSSHEKLVSFRVTVTNKSKVKVAAINRRPAYEDAVETLHFAVSLMLRATPARGGHGDPVTWFDDPGVLSPRAGDIELDLLNEYSLGRASEFWMEPGESYQLSASVFLKPATYIAMVTFVGPKQPDDFWRRTFTLAVP